MPSKGDSEHKESELEERLVRKRQSVWSKIDDEKRKEAFDFAQGYKQFLEAAKTERLAVKEIRRLAESSGYQDGEKVRTAAPGTKLYWVNREKSITLVCVGREPLQTGLRIIASHIDSPRLDLKPRPLYEESETEIALLKTHYYGGVKKYQWSALPLALHGRVIRSDGTHVDIAIGDSDDEPVFVVSDLAPHLYRQSQGERKLPEGLKGEELNILFGSVPIRDERAKAKVKLAVLDHLNRKHGMSEEDFESAELEAVPALKPRDVGLDRSMVGAYGQDDRLCAYGQLRAQLDVASPSKTTVSLFFDKEEIGSEGNTGARSRFTLAVLRRLVSAMGLDGQRVRPEDLLCASKALSADVTIALDPTFKDVHEPTNAPRLGFGVVIEKYGGQAGKAASSDANAEYVGWVRKLFNDSRIVWQTGELGKVDEGGGGTVAKFLALYDMDVLDCGSPILAGHSPFEISSKADLYQMYLAYKAFLGSE